MAQGIHIAGLKLGALTGSWAAWTTGTAQNAGGAANNSQQKQPANDEKAALLAYKNTALENARAKAAAEGRKPSLIDYYAAAEALGQAQAEAMAQQGIRWSERAYADMSGMKLDGFLVRERDVDPTRPIPGTRPAASRLQLAYAQAKAAANGTQPSRLDVLQALQTIQTQPVSQLQTKGLESLEYLYDLDGDDVISPLYKNIQGTVNFNGVDFEGCSFHPAGTLMHYHHENANFRDCTFDGMQEGDKVVLKGGNYENITLANLHGGELTIGGESGVATINGLKLEGNKLSKLHLEQAIISDFEAEAGIVKLEIDKDSSLSGARFTNATVEMNSTIRGKLTNVTFEDANLHGVDCREATLTRVNFKGSQIDGLDLRGAILSDIYVDGKLVNNMAELKGAITDDKTRMQNSHDAHRAELERQATKDEKTTDPLAEIGKTLNQAIKSIGQPVANAAGGLQEARIDKLTELAANRVGPDAQKQILPQPDNAQPFAIKLDGDVTLSDALKTGAGQAVAAIAEKTPAAEKAKDTSPSMAELRAYYSKNNGRA